MRKNKFLFLLPAATVITALPVIAASCNEKVKKETKEEAYNKQLAVYNTAYKTYNDKISLYAGELKAIKKQINKTKDPAEAKKLQEQRKTYVESKYSELSKLRNEASAEYVKLRKIQKGYKLNLLKIFHTNDEHGRIKFDDGKYNNYSGMQSYANIYKNADRDLFLSAGDLIQGLPLSDSDHGLTISKIAEHIGYDAVAVGNHEFDFGLDVVFNIDKETPKMPFLSANAVYNELAVKEKAKNSKGEEVKKGDYVFTPYIIKTLTTGVKVGLIGITTPDTKYTSNPKNSVHVDFLDPVEAANKASAELKAKGINIVIALTHLGVDRPQNEWDSRNFAKNVKDIDLVIDGHSHTLVALEKNNETYLSQTKAYTEYLSELDIVFDVTTGEIKSATQQLRDINQTELLKGNDNSLNKEVADLIEPLEKEFARVNNVVIFNSTIDFKHIDDFNSNPDGKANIVWNGRANQTNLGVFASDAIAYQFIDTKNDSKYTIDNTIGWYNGGGLRSNLNIGKVTRGQLFGVSPFGNRLVAVELTGEVLLEAMKHGAKKTLTGAFAQYSHNVEAKINSKMENDKKVYELDESSVKINSKAIDKAAKYYVVINDFLAVGGDGYTMFDYVKNPTKAKQVAEGDDLLEVLIKYAKFVTADNFTPSTTNPFGKVQLSYYGDKVNYSRVVVNHRVS